jgi:S1-C subfamily serine protease
MKILFWLLALTGCYSKNFELESNAMITKKELILICSEEEGCKIMGGRTTGTASRILWNEEYYWLTAGHVCTSRFEGSIVLESKIEALVAGSGSVESTEILKIDHEKDLCLLKARPDKTKRIARKSTSPGDSVSAVAYPAGIFEPGILPIYDGRWSGKLKENNKCLVSIPVSSGSSGAAVVNSNGEIVGVISSVLRDFNHLTLISCHQDLLDFLESK